MLTNKKWSGHQKCQQKSLNFVDVCMHLRKIVAFYGNQTKNDSFDYLQAHLRKYQLSEKHTIRIKAFRVKIA